MDKLFKLVFNNIVLSRLIYSYVRLYAPIYKRNECLKIYNKKSLIEHPEREFIGRLEYHCKEVVDIGDLPMNGVLKEITFNQELEIQGSSIPYGVEVLKLCFWSIIPSMPLSTLPSTIHTIKNVFIKSNLKNEDIPPNITSISFRDCPNISGNNEDGNGFITIPKTIKELHFFQFWDNKGIKLRPGDIHDSVLTLSIGGYQIKNLTKGVIPNLIKQLEITCSNDLGFTDIMYSNGLFDFLNQCQDIENLTLNCENCKITPESNLNKCKSINKLAIEIHLDKKKSEIKPFSIPSSVTDLSIIGYENVIEIGTIPNSVTSLKLYTKSNLISKNAIPNSVKSLTINSIIEDPHILPESLTHLELIDYLNDFRVGHSNVKIFKMVSNLPQSITSLKLPKEYKSKYLL